MEKGSTSRTRWDASHELGHLIMHVDVAAGSPELERQANYFGSAFLLPRDSFIHEAPRRVNWDLIWELKRRWKVSAAAIVRRCFDLGTISEPAYRRAFMYLNQTGQRIIERDEPPQEHPVALRKALEIIQVKWPLARIADELALSANDLQRLVSFATHPAAAREGM
ncbi:MAG: ImmA/IrrE family metallo-endopeptidase [Nannocystis sp.]|nr:ImmA/IrrE family metallo-endopeptidase [Nannocystis sp.]